MKKLMLVLGLAAFFLVFAATSYADLLCIGPGAFVPEDDNTDYKVSAGGQYLELVSGSSGNFHAQVCLPQGATINGIFMYYEDNSSDYVVCDFRRVNITIATGQTQFRVGPTSGASSGIRYAADWSLEAGQRDIKNQVFTYLIYVYFSGADPGNLRFYGCRIHYTP